MAVPGGEYSRKRRTPLREGLSIPSNARDIQPGKLAYGMILDGYSKLLELLTCSQ